MTMITPSYLGETIEYSSLHACRSTLEDPTCKDWQGLLHRSVCSYRTMRNIAEGDRIYRQMRAAMLSVEPTIGGLVSMNYALSKLIANYKLAAKKIDISVDDYIGDMVKWWEHQLEHGEADDQLEFDGFAYTVERLTEAQG